MGFKGSQGVEVRADGTVVRAGAAAVDFKSGTGIAVTGTDAGAVEVTHDADSPSLIPGEMRMYGGSAAPAGWLLCDGSAVSRATYADLFAVLGTNYGAGDGSTTFNLPDLRGRVPVGKGTHADIGALGDNDGVTLANRRPAHRHTVAASATINASANGASGGAVNVLGGGAKSGYVNPSVSVGADPVNDPLDAPAFQVVNFIIKT